MNTTQHIGWMLCWDLAGINIAHKKLIDLARINGVDEKYLPSEHSPTSAFKSAKSGISAWLKKDRMLFGNKPIQQDEYRLVYQLFTESEDRKIQQHEFLGQVEFRRKTGAINLLSGATNPTTAIVVVEKLKQEYQQCLNHGVEDFRSILTSWCDYNAIRLRSAGGFYFAPVATGAELQRIESLLQQISTASRLRKVRVLAEAEDLGFYQESAKEALQSEIDQISKDLDEFLSSVQTTAGKSKGTANRLKQYRELRQKVEAITSQLGIASQPLITKLDQLTSVLSGKPMPQVPPFIDLTSDTKKVEEKIAPPSPRKLALLAAIAALSDDED
jgi:methyl-accepting chemotaxis protein